MEKKINNNKLLGLILQSNRLCHFSIHMYCYYLLCMFTYYRVNNYHCIRINCEIFFWQDLDAHLIAKLAY